MIYDLRKITGQTNVSQCNAGVVEYHIKAIFTAADKRIDWIWFTK